MKLCVFQGTFNPIHNAHLRVVDFVLGKYDFDKILIIPAYQPPHKNFNPEMSFHRLEMVKLAFEGINKVEVSDIEYKREDKSYTYLTICELYKKYNIDGKINFIIGTDAFDFIESWYKADKLKELVKFIIFKRENNFQDLKYDKLKQQGYNFKIENLTFEDISSSEIRKNKNTDYLPEKIKEYILKNGLYEN
ncbi:nicotinate (nicotinamide) nucleotide adenylyltransferase [bacterium]|nr:nicotinate (nicotinamide) nucleotide adenylyltransferase [bacterium]